MWSRRGGKSGMQSRWGKKGVNVNFVETGASANSFLSEPLKGVLKMKPIHAEPELQQQQFVPIFIRSQIYFPTTSIPLGEI